MVKRRIRKHLIYRLCTMGFTWGTGICLFYAERGGKIRVWGGIQRFHEYGDTHPVAGRYPYICISLVPDQLLLYCRFQYLQSLSLHLDLHFHQLLVIGGRIGIVVGITIIR